MADGPGRARAVAISVASTMTVDARATLGCVTTRSMTRCRSAFDRATRRTIMSAPPVMVWASSTSGMSRRCEATGSWPTPRRTGALRDLQRRERRDREPQRGRIDRRRPAGDHSGRLEPVEPGLDGAAGDAEPARDLEHTDAWLGGKQRNDLAI